MLKKRKYISCKSCNHEYYSDLDLANISDLHDIGIFSCGQCKDTGKVLGEEHTYVECKICSSDPDYIGCKHCNDTREVIDPKEILCNLCGETMCITENCSDHTSQIPHGLIDASVSGGYDSFYLLDGINYTFSFCELCLRKLFIQCKVKPLITSYFPHDSPSSWEDDSYQYEYRMWAKNNGPHIAYENGMCNIYLNCKNKAKYTQYYDSKFSEVCACEDHKSKLEGYVGPDYTMGPFIKSSLKPFL